MRCLYCDIIDISPDDVGLLCVSCQWSLKLHILYPVDRGDGRGLVIVHSPASPLNPLGHERERADDGETYNPRSLRPDLTDEEVAELREEVYSLYLSPVCGPMGSRLDRARLLVAELERIGCRPYINSCLNLVVIDEPARVPHLLLVEFVRMQYWICDALTLEDSERIKRENRERAELAALIAQGSYNGTVEETGGAHLPTLQDQTRQPPAGVVLDVLLHAGVEGALPADEQVRAAGSG